jgi:hypothetical protein
MAAVLPRAYSHGVSSRCCASAFWYAFQPGHHLVCQRQIRAMMEPGLRSA